MAPSRRTDRALAGAERLPTSGRVLAGALVPLVLVLPVAAAAAGPELSFARHGARVATLDRDALTAATPPATVRVLEPYEGREVPFRALAFTDVLDAAYGKGWRAEEEILFTCRDGYQPTIPVERVRTHTAWLAFAREDQDAFTIRKRESGEWKRIELGPWYLVWENLDDPVVRQEADYGWPYQLVGIDLIRSRDRFPRMAPPADAPAPVRAGFAAFRVHCSRCHELHGEGGSIGPELSAAANPLAYRDPAWLRTWIEEPSKILPNARMPALNPSLEDRARVVDEILAYLAAMLETPPETPPSGPSDAS